MSATPSREAQLGLLLFSMTTSCPLPMDKELFTPNNGVSRKLATVSSPHDPAQEASGGLSLAAYLGEWNSTSSRADRCRILRRC